MEPEDSKISVWVCREEKLVSGLSRRTSCADVVKVLLEERGARGLCGAAQSYCIVEKWRGFERVLPNRTKILRLWSAWGDEQENVRFVLVKSDASLASAGPRSAEARVVLSKESPRAARGAARAATTFSQERQRRVVRKAFRKLEKMNKKRAQSSCQERGSPAEKMETLVHLVVSQDHTIRQQIQRIKELDREIDRYEAKVHLDRIKRHGVNYVQDTYLVDPKAEGEAPRGPARSEEEEREEREEEEEEEYARRCQELAGLRDELAEQEALLESVTAEIQEELNRRWMRRRRDELSGREPESGRPPGAAGSELLLEEEERVRTQLDASLYIGLRLNTDLEAVRSDLDLSKQLLDAKQEELRVLLQKVDSLDEEAPEEGGPGAVALEATGGWLEQARGLSKTGDANDEDSDTGLSSMHSQDSDTGSSSARARERDSGPGPACVQREDSGPGPTCAPDRDSGSDATCAPDGDSGSDATCARDAGSSSACGRDSENLPVCESLV